MYNHLLYIDRNVWNCNIPSLMQFFSNRIWSRWGDCNVFEPKCVFKITERARERGISAPKNKLVPIIPYFWCEILASLKSTASGLVYKATFLRMKFKPVQKSNTRLLHHFSLMYTLWKTCPPPLFFNISVC